MFPSPNFPIMIAPTEIAWFYKSICCRFPSLSHGVCLQKAHIRAINLRCANVSHPKSFILFSNIAALFCTQFKALSWPSHCGSQHTAPYSSIGLTSAVKAKRFVLLFPFLSTRIMKWSSFHAFRMVQLTWSVQFRSLLIIIPKYLNLLASGIKLWRRNYFFFNFSAPCI